MHLFIKNNSSKILHGCNYFELKILQLFETQRLVIACNQNKCTSEQVKQKRGSILKEQACVSLDRV